MMDRLQFNYEFFGSTTYRLKRTPEEYIKSGRVYFATDPDEATLPTVAAMIGEDHLVLGSDYCHPEGMSPYTMRILYERPDVSPTLKRKILSDSPGRLYRIAV
ncbi:MAG: amidohydrolase family protein [Chloroflexi bacterium]|nr:amidohydrolase family protein [Chloroflexota bacterium]